LENKVQKFNPRELQGDKTMPPTRAVYVCDTVVLLLEHK